MGERAKRSEGGPGPQSGQVLTHVLNFTCTKPPRALTYERKRPVRYVTFTHAPLVFVEHVVELQLVTMLAPHDEA